MTKEIKKAIDDPTNISFMALLDEDKSKVIGSIAVDEVMCGDWDAVQEDLGELHSIQAKACTLRKNLLENN